MFFAVDKVQLPVLPTFLIHEAAESIITKFNSVN